MKIVKILGGLGNQMFQYAHYIALRHRFPQEEVKIDLNNFRGYRCHNGFELEDIFGLPAAPRASLREVIRQAWPYFHYRAWQIGSRLLPRRKSMCVESQNMAFCPDALSRQGDTYYDGYWQDRRYFADAMEEVRKAFKFPPLAEEKNISVAEEMLTTKSVALHIRRGDYLKHKKYAGTCTVDYYAEAIKTINARNEVDGYYVFCNDATWYVSNIAPLLAGFKVTYVDWNREKLSFRDMQLMSMCKHMIIANSTFSWWAAMLHQHPDGTVIAPVKWFGLSDYHFSLPEEWIGV